jgi:hypothetical protein
VVWKNIPVKSNVLYANNEIPTALRMVAEYLLIGCKFDACKT